MRGDLYTGLVTLAGQFPPSVNTNDDVTALKPFESPACYGVDITRDGQLKTGTIPTSTDRVATTKSIGGYDYKWYYDRCWRIGNTASDLVYGAKFYDDSYVIQGRGKISAQQDIIGFQPAFKTGMWVYGADGSQMLTTGALSDDIKNTFDQIIQEMTVTDANCAVVLDGIPYCANKLGIWSYNGTAVTEISRPVRNSLGAFGTQPQLTCNYKSKYLVGTGKFAIDITNGKLFDYSTSGFLFTSRTLVAQSFRPYGIGDLFFSVQFSASDPVDGLITWQSKAEDNDWYDEADIVVANVDGGKTTIQVRPTNPCTTARKFAIRLTSLSDNVYIRSIDINVSEYDQGTISA